MPALFSTIVMSTEVAGTHLASSSVDLALDRLLRDALAHPDDAMTQAQSLLASEPDSVTGSVARQVIGIVLRDNGQPQRALVELTTALHLARSSGRGERVADVLASLGAAMFTAGDTPGGLDHLNQAAEFAHGELLARVRMRRAHVLSLIGDHPAALDDLRLAIRGLRRAGDTVWEARALNNRCLIHIAIGALGRAERDARRAENLFLAAGQDLEAVHATHNRGVIACRKGDLPQALRLFDAAAVRYADLHVTSPDLAIDRCQTFLALGLTAEAVGAAESALLATSIAPSKRAELLLAAAAAALAAGDHPGARRRATQANRLFVAQHRERWRARTTLIATQARFADGRRDKRLFILATENAVSLDGMRADEAALAHLLAGHLAADRDPVTRDAHFAAAARHRHQGSPLTQATGWLAQALLSATTGHPRGVLAACSRGLDMLDAQRLTLGSTELRALATGHGRELASIALRHVVSHSDARTLLRWSERWRATALAMPQVRPPNDAEVAGQLTALREAIRRREEARSTGVSSEAIEKDQERWESVIRRHRYQLEGTGGAIEHFDLDALLADLADTTLVEIIDIDGIVYALVVADGRVRRYRVGPVEHAQRAVEMAHFGLRRTAFGRPADVAAFGARLQSALLGSAAAALGDGAVVIAPPGRFHAVPWALLPVLRSRTVSVSPSAALWLRARGAPAPQGGNVVLIAGPGLSTGGAEVTALADQNPAALLLRDGSATVEKALQGMDGASLVHIASHGQFRVDSPLFSNLQLDDGPLTVHDLERLHRAPYRLVLSACDSGVGAPVGGDETLGLVSALLSLGSASVLCSVTKVNDDATVQVMLDVHAAVKKGLSLPAALVHAGMAARGDPLREATAAAFVSLGA